MTSVLDKDGLQAVIVAALKCQPTTVVWATDPEPFVSDQDRYIVKLDVFSITKLGVDEHRRAYGPDGYPSDAYVTTEAGNRTVVITVRVDAFDKGVEAAEIIDIIRTRIQAEWVRDRLDAISLAYVDSMQALRVKNTVDTRVVNSAVADFTFAGVAIDVSSIVRDSDPTGGPVNPGDTGGWIETVEPPTADLTE